MAIQKVMIQKATPTGRERIEESRTLLTYVFPDGVGSADSIVTDQAPVGAIQVPARPSVFHVYDPELVGKWRKDPVAAVGMSEADYNAMIGA